MNLLFFATYIAAVVHPLEGRGTVSLPAASYIESDSPQELIREVVGQVTITNKTWMAWPASASVQLNSALVGMRWTGIGSKKAPLLTDELKALEDWIVGYAQYNRPDPNQWEFREEINGHRDQLKEAEKRRIELADQHNDYIVQLRRAHTKIWRRKGYVPTPDDPEDPYHPDNGDDDEWWRDDRAVRRFLKENLIRCGILAGLLIEAVALEEADAQPATIDVNTGWVELDDDTIAWLPKNSASAAWSLSMLWENPDHFAQNIFKILESGTLPGITWNMAVWGGVYSDELLISRLSELPHAVHPWAEWPLAFAFASQVGFGDERIEGEFESIKPGPAGMLTDSLVLKGVYEAFNPPSWSMALKEGEEIFLMCEVGLAMRPELRITGPDYLTSYRVRAEFGETVFIDKFVVNNSGLWQIKLDYQGSDNPLLEPGIQEHHVAFTLHVVRNGVPEQEPNNTLLCPQPVSLAEYASVVGRADNYGLWDIYQVKVNAGDRISMGVEPLEGEHNVQVAWYDTGCSCLQYGPTGGNTVPYSTAFAGPLESGFLTIYVRGAWGQRYHLTLTRNGGQDTENRLIASEDQQTGSTRWTGRVGDYFDDGRARATTRQDEEDIYIMNATYPARIEVKVDQLNGSQPIEVEIKDEKGITLTPEIDVVDNKRAYYRFMVSQPGDHTITLKNHDGTAYKMEVQEERIEWDLDIQLNGGILAITYPIAPGFNHTVQVKYGALQKWEDLPNGPHNVGQLFVDLPGRFAQYRLRITPKGVGK